MSGAITMPNTLGKKSTFSAQVYIKAYTSNDYIEALLCTANRYSIEEKIPGEINVYIHELEIDEFTDYQYRKIPRASIDFIKKQLAEHIKNKLLD